MTDMQDHLPTLSSAHAESWIARWDAQQERYIAARDDRFVVMAAAVELATGPAPLVLDLGCGPGSLGARLHRTLPAARVVGVDADPVLLALARATQPSVLFVDADLTDPGWVRATGLTPGSVDAVLSTTALHWLDPEGLTDVIEACARLLRPGGLWLDGDHLSLPGNPSGLTAIAKCLREADERCAQRGDTWEQWWQAVLTDPALAAPAAERRRRYPVEHPAAGRREPTYQDYTQALTIAGFAETAELWRRGDDVVLAALR